MFAEFLVNFYHGQFYHISRRTLYGGVDGIAFRKSTNSKVGAVNIFEPTLAPHQRLHITMFLRKVNGIVHVFLNIWKLFFVIINDLFRFGTADGKIFRQAKCTLPINDPKIYALCLITHFFGYLFFIYIKNSGSRGVMNVFTGPESFAHIYITADSSNNT